ncbi:Pinin-like protein [Drosera capensis]
MATSSAITERIKDPRGLRRAGAAAGAVAGGGGGGRFGANGAPRGRGFVRPADRRDSRDEPAPKRRLSSAVVKVKDGEVIEKAGVVVNGEGDFPVGGAAKENVNDNNFSDSNSNSWSGRRDGKRMVKEVESLEMQPVPRVLPKDEDPKLVSRNRRMLGQLLGTLEKFRKEDMQLSGTEAYMRRSNSLQRAEQRAREESEKLRQQEREQIAENRKRDLILRARVWAKAEERKLDLLFLKWCEHNKRLTNFLRTKAEPPIYYSPVKPLEEDPSLAEQKKEQILLEWKAARREELSAYQKQLSEQYIANAQELQDRWQNGRKQRKGNNELNLQETMDKELDTHRVEHGPKTRKIAGGNPEDEDDVEDITVGEDDMLDDVLGVEENGNENGSKVEDNVKDADDGTSVVDSNL